MANERLRDALLSAGVTVDEAAKELTVDPKPVERWTTQGRTPYARHRRKLSTMLGQAESYLWPAAVPPERQAAIAASEVVGVYPHRNTVSVDLWDRVISAAADRIDILVHAGLFLAQRPDFIQTLADKAAAGVTVRIAFGDPDSEAINLRSHEERLGDGTLGARIRYGLVPYSPLQGVPGIEFRFHTTPSWHHIRRKKDILAGQPYLEFILADPGLVPTAPNYCVSEDIVEVVGATGISRCREPRLGLPLVKYNESSSCAEARELAISPSVAVP